MRHPAPLALICAAALAATPVMAAPIVRPTPAEARQAMARLFGDPDVEKRVLAGEVTLGTCLATPNAAYLGQISCTVAVRMGAGSSETQADFHPGDDGWIAAPTRQDLPFPDPALHP